MAIYEDENVLIGYLNHLVLIKKGRLDKFIIEYYTLNGWTHYKNVKFNDYNIFIDDKYAAYRDCHTSEWIKGTRSPLELLAIGEFEVFESIYTKG